MIISDDHCHPLDFNVQIVFQDELQHPLLSQMQVIPSHQEVDSISPPLAPGLA